MKIVCQQVLGGFAVADPVHGLIAVLFDEETAKTCAEACRRTAVAAVVEFQQEAAKAEAEKPKRGRKGKDE